MQLRVDCIRSASALAVRLAAFTSSGHVRSGARADAAARVGDVLLTMKSSALRARYAPLIWLACVFLAIAFLTRLALLIKTGHGVPADPLQWLYLFGVGLGYDLVAFVYFAWPLV